MKEIDNTGLRCKCDTEQSGVKLRKLQGKRRDWEELEPVNSKLTQMLHIWKITTRLA